MRNFLVFVWVLGLGMLLVPPWALAHGTLQAPIAALDRELALQPANLAARLERADFLRLEGDFGSALEDLAAIDAISPANPDAAWIRARVLVDQGREAPAIVELNRWLSIHPAHPGALELRARARTSVGDLNGALLDYDAAIAAAPAPDPDLFSARAEVQRARRSGPTGAEEALAGLLAGIRKLGPVPGLELAALRLELDLGRYQDALLRIDALAATATRKETWLARRADILEQMGREDAARATWEEAVAACEALPPGQFRTPAIQALLKQARSRLRPQHLVSG